MLPPGPLYRRPALGHQCVAGLSGFPARAAGTDAGVSRHLAFLQCDYAEAGPLVAEAQALSPRLVIGQV